MWDIELGYTTENTVRQHWELIFRYDESASDDSMDCECSDCACEPNQCQCAEWPNCSCGSFNHDYFDYDETTEKVEPFCEIHVCHAIVNDSWQYEYEHTTVSNVSEKITCTDRIGTFTNSQLAEVVSVCANTYVPTNGDGECQNWVRWALSQMRSDGAANLNSGYKKVLKGIAVDHNGDDYSHDWEEGDSEDSDDDDDDDE